MMRLLQEFWRWFKSESDSGTPQETLPGPAISNELDPKFKSHRHPSLQKSQPQVFKEPKYPSGFR